MYDYDDDLNFIHDEDSDRPNSICDIEPEKDHEQEYVNDIIQETITDLEEGVGQPWTKQTLTITRGTALRALQLLKAYSTLYELTFSDYNYDYD